MSEERKKRIEKDINEFLKDFYNEENKSTKI